MEIAQYSWKTGKGDLIAFLNQKPISFQIMKEEQITPITYVEGLPLDTPLEKVEEVFIRYFPIIKENRATFYESVIPEPSSKLIKEETSDEKDFSFTFNQLENIRKVAFAKEKKDSNIYLRVIQGLNMEGKCNNSDCLANKKVVMVPLGYGGHNIGIIRATLKCPACEHPIKKETVTNLGFWDCHYVIEGLRKGEQELLKKEEVAPKDHFRTFQNDEDCEWEALQVKTFAVDKKPVNSSDSGGFCHLL